ncbi:MAG: Ldh family oxidoreductase [Planctomycetia bacterium]|nr:Ldh family oxidoreductase [Planctomycetia bacterium]
MPNLTHDALRRWARDCLQAVGARPSDACLVAHHLVDANLAGHDSHGLLRVSQYVAAVRSGDVDVASQPRIVQEMPGGVVLDGARGFGQVVAQTAVEEAIRKARATGVAAATVRNCYHTGRIGSYTEHVAAAGMVGIVMVNAGGGGQTVAPFGGLARRLATNPISIAAPSGDEFPLVLDIATSVAPEGKIRALAQQSRATPAGWMMDARGRPTTNTDDFYSPSVGALLPLGGPAGYKGFGLGLMIDVLAGALSGAGCSRKEVVEARDGMLIIAIDIARFGMLAAFQDQVRELIGYVKSSPPAPGFEEILVPGETEHGQRMNRLREGISIDDALWKQLLSLGKELEVAPPELAHETGTGIETHSGNGKPRRTKLVRSFGRADRTWFEGR